MSVSFTFMNFMLNTRNLDKNKILTDTLFYFIKTQVNQYANGNQINIKM